MKLYKKNYQFNFYLVEMQINDLIQLYKREVRDFFLLMLKNLTLDFIDKLKLTKYASAFEKETHSH